MGFIFGYCLSHTEETGETQIKNGGLFGLTGYASFAGEASRNGFLMAIEDSGMHAPYVVEDFESVPAKAVTAAKKLIEVDKVTTVIGPEWAEFGEVVASIAKEKKVLFLSPWLTAEKEWIHGYYGSAMPSVRGRLNELTRYIAAQNIKSITLVFSNDTWATDNVRIFKQELSKQAPEVKTVIELKTIQDATDYHTEIVKLQQAKPDSIYIAFAEPASQGNFSRQLYENNIHSTVFAPFEMSVDARGVGTYRGTRLKIVKKESSCRLSQASKRLCKRNMDRTGSKTPLTVE